MVDFPLIDVIQKYSYHYRQLKIDYTVPDGKGGYFIFISGINQNFCLNKGDHHHSSQIFFHINAQGILKSRCSSRKYDENSTCRHFQGPEIQVFQFNPYLTQIETQLQNMII